MRTKEGGRGQEGSRNQLGPVQGNKGPNASFPQIDNTNRFTKWDIITLSQLLEEGTEHEKGKGRERREKRARGRRGRVEKRLPDIFTSAISADENQLGSASCESSSARHRERSRKERKTVAFVGERWTGAKAVTAFHLFFSLPKIPFPFPPLSLHFWKKMQVISTFSIGIISACDSAGGVSNSSEANLLYF